jgi:hypothetical protein
MHHKQQISVRINISDRQAVVLVGVIGKIHNEDLENSVLSRFKVH